MLETEWIISFESKILISVSRNIYFVLVPVLLLSEARSVAISMAEPGPSGVQPSPSIKVRNPASVVRQHFEDILIPNEAEPGHNKQGALCNDCGAMVSQRTSSAMKKHLKKHHPDLYQQVESKYTILK